ncbi:MAG: hypothetical protein CMJ23_08150 [Phycisphaerae bacterium]|nr:hypothetical protein [Phycisphaerae bacterium]
MSESVNNQSDASTVLDWAAVYRELDLETGRARYHEDLRYERIALGRGLAERLGRPDVYEGLRPEVEPQRLPPATVFILGATAGESPGCLGHVSAASTIRSLGLVSVGGSDATIRGAEEVVSGVIAATLDAVRPLAPDAGSPRLEVVTPREGEGDSHALAVGMASLHALLDASAPQGLAATGGFNPETRRFTTVSPVTLSAKAAAASRWGITRVLVVDGQVIPKSARLPGIEWLPVSADPAGLLLALLQPSAVKRDPVSQDVLRQALALYDIQVARSRREPLSTVFRVTSPYLAMFDADVDADVDSTLQAGAGSIGTEDPGGWTPPAEAAIATALQDFRGDPILSLLAADIRSRVLLHAGRTIEASGWNRVVAALRGRGDLPPGLLGDHLLYQQPAHESMIAIDLALLDDDADGSHARLDRAISSLDQGWTTRHQKLLHLFATNTRWRRRLYRARRDLDLDGVVAASRDLLRHRPWWSGLLEDHATRNLRMGNSDLARQWNYLIEHHLTHASLSDAPGHALAGARVPRAVRDEVRADTDLVAEIRRREAAIAELSAFDVRGLLQGWWLLDEVDVERGRRVLESHQVDSIWIEFMRRFVGDEDAVVVDGLRAALVPHLGEGSAEVNESVAGIGRLVALRRAAILDAAEIRGDGTRGWLHSIRTPVGPASLRRAFLDLRAAPGSIMVRTPY